MKIALVHDFLREYGGAERVVEALHELWPEAPLYTAFVDWEALGSHAYRFKNWDIRPSWVQHNWLVKKFHSPLRFLAPDVWGSFDLSGYDVVISSSGWFMCRGVNTGRAKVSVPWFSRRQGPDLFSLHDRTTAKAVTALKTTHLPAYRHGPLHICYIHHPPRNLYGYATGSNLQKYWPVRVYTTIINFFLRHYDFATAQKVDYFVANSKETAKRVTKFYRRDSTVIYPPVDVSVTSDKQHATSQKQNMSHVPGHMSQSDYFLSVGRLTYSKRIDLAIIACNKLKLPLKIVGKGKEETYLRSIAARPPSADAEGAAGWSPTIEFIGGVSDAELSKLYAGARGFIFCALDEDFGMVPVESMAHGVPVIALGQGGVLETVIDGKTGVLFKDATTESLETALKKFMRMKKDWSRDCVAQAKKFSKENFQNAFKKFVDDKFFE
ncbi:MAG TPA: glycosyltransferase [Patescibacteria group bacterium]|nr:glycosyltransferase [Patescibacteria group bacterium]